MIEITIEQIQEKFNSLPEELRWAIMSSNVDEKITELGRMHNLTVQQMGQLSLETHAVMLGFTHPDKFEESVRLSLGFDKDKTSLLINAINEKILKEVRDQVLLLHSKPKTEDSSEPQIPESDNKIIEESVNAPKTQTEPIKIETKTENQNNIDSILSKKLAGAFKMGGATTEYSLNNISKQNESSNGNIKENNAKSVDPYRMPIE